MQTKTNLMLAFAAESQARNRYTFYAAQAKKDGYREIATVFDDTSHNEYAHGEFFYKLLMKHWPRQQLQICAAYPVLLASTPEVLYASILIELQEGYDLYLKYANIAGQEGFPDAAQAFSGFAGAERYHAERFTRLYENLRRGLTFHRPQPVRWRCLNCGYTTIAKDAPSPCPACHHPQAYFTALEETACLPKVGH